MPEYVVVWLVGFYPVLLVSVWLHELGHAVGGRLVGLDVVAFGVGTKPPFFVCNLGFAKTYFTPFGQFVGFAWPHYYTGPTSSWRLAAFILAGPFANLLVAGAAWRLMDVWPPLTGLTLAVNLIMGMVSLVPMTFVIDGLPMASDGRLLLQLLRGNLEEHWQPDILALRAFEPLWEALGERPRIRDALRRAAIEAGFVHEFEAAADFARRAEAVDVPDRPSARRGWLVARARMWCDAGRLAKAAESLREAEAACDAPDSPAWQAWITLARAELCFAQGELELARGHADRLLSLLRDAPPSAHATRITASRLRARLAAAQADEVEFQAARSRCESGTKLATDSDVAYHDAVATADIRAGRTAEACEACRRVVLAAQSILDRRGAYGFTAPLPPAVVEAVARAGDFLRSQGVTEVPLTAQNELLSLEEREERKRAVRQKADRRWLPIGLGLLAVNVSVVAGGMALLKFVGPKAAPTAVLVTAGIAFFCFLPVVVGTGLYACLIPLRRLDLVRPGKFLTVLGVLPWILAGLIGAIAIALARPVDIPSFR